MNKISRKTQKYLFFLAGIIVVLASSTYLYWEYSSDASCVKIPVKISRSDTPIINVYIEEKKYPVKFELGSFSSALDTELLDKINKVPGGPVRRSDVRGNPYETQSFLISQMKIGGLVWANVKVGEINAQIRSGSFYGKYNEALLYEEMGEIGSSFLEKTNLCLDYYHRAIYRCNSLKVLQKLKICPKNMIKIPFQIKKGFMVIQPETDFGRLNLALSSSSFTVVRTSFGKELTLQQDWGGLPFDTSTRFILSGNDFGKLDIHFLDIDPKVPEVDGILGMNFLENNILYIDYPNRFIYIADCHP